MNSHHATAAEACDDLVRLFNDLFYLTYNTELVKGGLEPIYLPADSAHATHRIIFTQDYFASALHEIAHWCIAGEARLQQVDYGYWYVPDGRNAEQQRSFEQVEVKPQALECLFSLAAGRTFHVSADNLNGVAGDCAGFGKKVRAQALAYLREGMPHRAQIYLSALLKFYRNEIDLSLLNQSDTSMI